MESLECRQMLAITVTTLVDEADGSIVDGDISLRDAIALAPAGEEINFDPALTAGGAVTLNLAIPNAITVAKAMTITGPGASLLTIDGSAIDPTPNSDNGDGKRLFLFDDGLASRAVVTMQGLTLTGADGSGFGGAISNGENLTLRNMVIRNNAAVQGAGIGSGGPLAIYDSEIYLNDSDQAGGGIHLNSAAVADYKIIRTTIRDNFSGGRGGGVFSTVPLSSLMTITDSLISNNESSLDGGGLSAIGPHTIINSAIVGNTSAMNGGGIKAVNALTVQGSLIDDNTAANGGGIHAEGALTVRDTTISNNEASTNAGGVYVQNNTSQFSQVTVSGNTANGSGGGIYSTVAITIRHSTIAENVADDDNSGGGSGGGIFGTQPVGTPIVVDQSIISANRRGPSSSDQVVGAIALRYSLISDNTGATITDNGNNQIGTGAANIDPKLGTLLANDSRVLPGGNYRLTHELAADSPAVDAGDPAAVGAATTPTNDERGTGFARIWNSTGLPAARIDMGAFERQPIPLFADYNNDGTVDAADYTVWRNAFGSTTELFSDGDRNDVVDAQDYIYWKSRYGQTEEEGSAASASVGNAPPTFVPEELASGAATSFATTNNLELFSGPIQSLPAAAYPSAETSFESRPDVDASESESTQASSSLDLSYLWAYTTAPAEETDGVASDVGAAVDASSDESQQDESTSTDPFDAAFAQLGGEV
jgi:predicted outer membrane repeat protein